MSKELKFKAWHTVEKRWATHDELLSGVPVSATVREKVLTVGGNDWELVPYTGLKDCKGADVYEGYIMKRLDWDDVYVVKSDNEQSGFYLHDTSNKEDDHMSMLMLKEFDLEVIGNIYEHPHLLEV